LPLSYDGGTLEGKIDVFLRIRYANENKYDTLPAGKIENGKLSLSLPSIDSKYNFESWYYHEGEDPLSITPQNLVWFYSGSNIRATIPGRDGCYLRANLINKEMYRGRAMPIYNSASGTVTGTRSEESLNLTLSQGWQIIYIYVWNSDRYIDDDGDERSRVEHWTSTLPANTTIKWEITSCD
jgi:hypothetical protein